MESSVRSVCEAAGDLGGSGQRRDRLAGDALRLHLISIGACALAASLLGSLVGHAVPPRQTAAEPTSRPILVAAAYATPGCCAGGAAVRNTGAPLAYALDPNPRTPCTGLIPLHTMQPTARDVRL